MSAPNGEPSELVSPRPSLLHALPSSSLAPPGPVLASFPGPAPAPEASTSHGHAHGAASGQADGKGVPSFQDLTDESGSEGGSEDWEAWVKAAETLFTEEQIATMHEYLKERGLFAFLKRYLDEEGLGVNEVLLAMGVMVRPDTPLSDQIRMLKIACSRVLRNREKLEAFNSPEDVVSLIRRSRKILILTGAGVSTSCGIPDFRSPTGLYARLKEEHWELDDPQDMFDLAYFKEKPNVFYSFAKEIYPSNFVPSPCHRFVKLLEMNDRLLRNYTQNIDGLFEQVGVEKMLNCHGSFATASCLLCRRRFPGSAIEADVFASRVPLCPYCTAEQKQREEEEAEAKRREEEEPPKKKKKKSQNEWEEGSEDEKEDGMPDRGEWDGKALVKPDIVFFGEALSDEFDRRLLEDRDEVDLLIVIGTSLRVSPVAQLPSHLPHSIPQVLINRDPVSHHQFDVCLLGDGDTVVKWICEELQKLPPPAVGGKTKPGEEEKKIKDAEGEKEKWDLDARVPATAPHPSSPAAASSSATGGDPPLTKPEEPFPSLPAPHPGAEPGSWVPEQVGSSHVWLFPGANRESRWVQSVRAAYEDDEDQDGEAGENGVGEGQGREVRDGDDAPVELPVSLAPGMPEGEGSDGEVDVENLSDEEEEGLG
ncbi:hypothetical protein JCM11251_001358 [Rhodosporidiobolus azoricus]